MLSEQDFQEEFVNLVETVPISAHFSALVSTDRPATPIHAATISSQEYTWFSRTYHQPDIGLCPYRRVIVFWPAYLRKHLNSEYKDHPQRFGMMSEKARKGQSSELEPLPFFKHFQD
ncbi:MAG: hypothetical protein AMJ65_17055 [Phycisphaerae bacterium SG8_4]|nr:MAG: hypothetical protein AMJ65_17055 [Phycisphaerae bacterium SG8_4]